MYFEIDEVEDNINTQTQISFLYSYINQLLNETKELKEKNKKLEEKLEEIDKLFLLPYKKKLKEDQEKEKESQKDLDKIKEWIAPGKNITFNLLFRKCINGSTTLDFHKYCDYKGKTLIIIETIEGR